MDNKWLCSKCKSLLGYVQEAVLHIRYRDDVQLVIEGRDYRLIRTCRRCKTLNVWQEKNRSEALKN